MSDRPHVTVHGVPGSPYVRAVLIACEEKGLAWRIDPLAPGASKQPAHLARHPFGKIPAVEVDGFALYETQAIVRYLDRIGSGPSLTPAEPHAEARMNQIIGVNDCYLFPGGVGLVFPKVVAPRLGFPADESGVADALAKLEVALAALAALMGEGPFLAGEALSLADVLVVPHIDFLAQTEEGKALIAAHRTLAGWLERMNGRPSLRETTWDALDARVAQAA